MLLSNTRSNNFNTLIALSTRLQQLVARLKRKPLKTQVCFRFCQLVQSANSYLYRLVSFRASEDKTIDLIKQTIKALNLALARLDWVFTELREDINNLLERLFKVLPNDEFVQLELIDESEYIDKHFQLKKFPSFLDFLARSAKSDNYFRKSFKIPKIKVLSFPLRFT